MRTLSLILLGLFLVAVMNQNQVVANDAEDKDDMQKTEDCVLAATKSAKENGLDVEKILKACTDKLGDGHGMSDMFKKGMKKIKEVMGGLKGKLGKGGDGMKDMLAKAKKAMDAVVAAMGGKN